MKIKSIHIYSHDGQRQDLEFHVDGLNVIRSLIHRQVCSLRHRRILYGAV